MQRPLTPGKYRLNPFAYVVTKVPATVIHPGSVGCVTLLTGAPSPEGQLAEPGHDLPWEPPGAVVLGRDRLDACLGKSPDGVAKLPLRLGVGQHHGRGQDFTDRGRRARPIGLHDRERAGLAERIEQLGRRLFGDDDHRTQRCHALRNTTVHKPNATLGERC